MWSTAELVGAAFPLAEVSGVCWELNSSLAGKSQEDCQTSLDQSWLLGVPAKPWAVQRQVQGKRHWKIPPV